MCLRHFFLKYRQGEFNSIRLWLLSFTNNNKQFFAASLQTGYFPYLTLPCFSSDGTSGSAKWDSNWSLLWTCLTSCQIWSMRNTEHMPELVRRFEDLSPTGSLPPDGINFCRLFQELDLHSVFPLSETPKIFYFVNWWLAGWESGLWYCTPFDLFCFLEY